MSGCLQGQGSREKAKPLVPGKQPPEEKSAGSGSTRIRASASLGVPVNSGFNRLHGLTPFALGSAFRTIGVE
jgi:hypothetical protein